MELRRLIISIAIISPVALYSQINRSIEEHFSPMPNLMENAWHNPALIGYEYSTSLTRIGATFYNGDKERYGQFKAETFMRLKNITINAQAHYDNGAKHDVIFCENADVAKIYPYLTYDGKGGNQNLERYSFGGEIAVKVNYKWNIGAEASYDAGLYYRHIDPRPKTVTGNFKIGAGASYSLFENYAIGISGDYEKYKQSCDIIFKSEQGESKIYHLTGLGTQYNRFAGQGKTSYYTGASYSTGITLLSFEGFYADAKMKRESITQILEDLNNLPMSKTISTTASFQFGYKTGKLGITASAELDRMHGYENIFGDAATGQYPQIGTIAMFMANSNYYSVKSVFNCPLKRVLLFLSPILGYRHYREIYREPGKELSLDYLNAGLECKAITTIREKVTLYGCISYKYSKPLTNTFQNISTDNPDIQANIDILKHGFENAASRTHDFEISAGSDLMICRGKYSVGVEVSYIKNKYIGNNSLFSASFKF